MATVQQIEQDITTLSADELRELYAWLDQNRPHPFDEQIAADMEKGRLDKIMLQAIEDVNNGHYGRSDARAAFCDRAVLAGL